MFMRKYASFREKRKSFYRKIELQMLLLISGGHIGAPKRYTNMAFPYSISTKYKHRFLEVFRRIIPRKTSFRQDPIKLPLIQEPMKRQKSILVLNVR